MDTVEEVVAASRSPEPAASGGKEARFAALGAPARVSALVVNFNTRACVLRCLEALRRAPVGGGLQVVVVDNASADGSAEAVRAAFHPSLGVMAGGDKVRL